jgi:hypothetical protein
LKFTSKDIVEIFSYTESEQESFVYLRDYMRLVKPELTQIESDNEKLKRFALIGLFLAYRTCNFMGNELTTDINLDDRNNLYVKRILAIIQYFDIKILNSSDYLRMIKFSKLDLILISLRITNISNKFYKFVMFGK